MRELAVAETRKIAAILAADVVGFSRLTGADEDGTLAALRALRAEHTDPTIATHNGRVFKRTGDGFLVEFRSVTEAARCAVGLQAKMPERNAGLPSDRRIEFRIGVHLGDIIEEADGDLMGDGVNIAARLEGICEPNCVCLSGAAYDQIRDKLDCRVIDLGEKELKNIRRPVRAYQIEASPAAVALGATAPRRTESGRPLTDRASLAVLPFQNLGGDPETDYFADGVIEDVITALSRVPVALRHRPELILHLQDKVHRRPSDRARTRRSIPSRWINPQSGKAGSDFGAAHRGRYRPAHLGRPFRRRPRGDIRTPGSHHDRRCGRGRAEPSAGRDRARAEEANEQSRRLRSLPSCPALHQRLHKRRLR